MTQAQAKLTLRALGFTMSRRDGEFRIAPMDGTPAQKEARAYYTDDLSDAVGTARQERARGMRDAACEAHRAARQQERAAGTFDYGVMSWETTDIAIPTGWQFVETSI